MTMTITMESTMVIAKVARGRRSKRQCKKRMSATMSAVQI